MNSQQYPVEAEYPLSCGQESFWILNQLDSAHRMYNMQMVWRIPNDLDIALLQQCLAYLQERHPAWRTTFPIVDGKPRQRVHANLPLDFSHSQVSAAELESRLDEEFRQPLDLTRQTAIRWQLFDVNCDETLGDGDDADDCYRVISWFMHHIITDKWSVVRTANELKTLYAQARAGESLYLAPLKKNYADFIEAQQVFIGSEHGEQQKAFWCEHLKGYTAKLNLPFDLAGSVQANTNGEKQETAISHTIQPRYYPFELDPQTTAAFSAFCSREKISPYSAYLSCAQLLLHRLSGDRDISLASPTAGRDESFAGIFNCFINPIIARANIKPEQSAQDFLRQNNQRLVDCLANQDYPLAAVLPTIVKDRSYQHSNFCPTGFVWQNINRFENRDDPIESWPNLQDRIWHMGEMGEWRRLIRNLQIDEFHICFKFYKFSNGLYAGIEYNGALFSEALISSMAAAFNALLRAIMSQDQTIAQLPLVDEQHIDDCILRNPISCDNGDFVNEFEKQAALQADSIALKHNGTEFSYRALNNAANRFAVNLLSQCKPGENIGISLDKGFELYASIIGILKAGCAYVPLDAQYPRDRLEHMVSDSAIELVVTNHINAGRLPAIKNILYIDDFSFECETDSDNVDAHRTAQQCAYIIYTSGSTGKPKGVAISHNNWRSLIASQRQAFDCGNAQRVLQFASLNFDASVFTMTWALANGGAMICADKLSLLGPDLINLCRQEQVSAGVLPPSLLQQYQAEDLPTWKDLVVAGEACPQNLAERWSAHLNLYNGYGPTESTVWASVAKLSPHKPVNIGRAVAGATICLLDENLQPVPRGIPGEIFIAGDCVGLGYYHNAELTKRRFLTLSLPHIDKARYYRSGDLARINRDGELEFLGRIDDQVKIRGFRIELSEVSGCCEQHDAVQSAFVTTLSNNNSEDLVAYVIPKVVATDKTFSPNEYQQLMEQLRAHCKDKLPDYMVPGFFVPLAKFPLTPNDKIDKHALPRPENFQQHRNTIQAVSNGINRHDDLENIIAGIWCQVLGITHAAKDINFFDLGGHSLKVVEVFNALPRAISSWVTLVDLYQYTTIESLAQFIRTHQETAKSSGKLLTKAHNRKGPRRASDDEIAVIGIALRVPGANNPTQFWQNLLNGVSSISHFSREELLKAGVIEELINKPYYVPAKGVIDNIDCFDAAFFAMSPREAQITDPQQRVFLECAWDALESAGYATDGERANIGVYAGVGNNRYYTHHIASHPTLEQTIGDYPIQLGNNQDFLATRIAYKLHLNGPAMTVQTACSTSLVAIHTAAQALRKGECDLAIAGGISLGNLARKGYLYVDGMIHSKDGCCRPFDEQANGTVGSEGAAVVLLKPLRKAIEAGDEIIATLKGSAVNNDGAEKAGFTAPSPQGQKAVIEKAINNARISADQIGYVEAHGTATKLGDPIEVAGLTQAYHKFTDEAGFAYLGSVKSNIGHLDAAAGATGFIKAALAVREAKIPPTLHFKSPNKNIDFLHSPFRVNKTAVDFPRLGDRRYAGVSSFGLGGTNAHAIVAQADNSHLQSFADNREGEVLVTLSALSPNALKDNIDNLISYLDSHPQTSLNHLAYTTRVRRKAFKTRIAFVAKDLNSLRAQLAACEEEQFATASEHKSVWLFPGQGSQYIGLCQQLSDKDPQFAEDLDACRQRLCAIAVQRGLSINETDLRGLNERIHTTALTQPVIFIASYCLARALQRAGLGADAMLGHSLGEYVAATLAGVLSLDDALYLVAVRGQLIASLPTAAMLAVTGTINTIAHILVDFPELDLAAENSPSQFVFSGSKELILQVEQAIHSGQFNNLQEFPIRCKKLKVSHAFHSRRLEPMLADFRRALNNVSLHKPKQAIVSSLTGNWLSDSQAQSRDYWINHLRHSVKFGKAISCLLNDGYRHFVEVGPGQILSALSQEQAAAENIRIRSMSCFSDSKAANEWNNWLNLLAGLWRCGARLDWQELGMARGLCIKIPTYAFQRQRYWVEPVHSSVKLGLVDPDSIETYTGTDIDEDYQGPEKRGVKNIAASSPKDVIKKVRRCWQELLGDTEFADDTSFFELGGSSLLAVQLSTMLNEQFGLSLSPATLIEFDTVKTLSDSIHDQLQRKPHARSLSSVSDSAGNRHLLCLKTGERRRKAPGFCKTLIMIHPISGEVYYFYDLAKHLPPNISFHAIEAPSLSGSEAPIIDVSALADRYLAIIREQFPLQSIVLGGASFGGLVALEIAKQISERDGIRLPVILGDTPTPESIAPFVKPNNRAIFEYLLDNAFNLGKTQFPYNFDFLSLDDQLQWISELCAKANITLPESFSKAMVKTWIAHQTAMINYQPPQFSGEVLYLRADTPMQGFPARSANAWLNYLHGDLHFKRIPGTHISMNFGENSEVMAKAIAQFVVKSSVDLSTEPTLRRI